MEHASLTSTSGGMCWNICTNNMIKENKMDNKINYNVDDFGVLRVYRGNAILFEAQGFQNATKEEIENFIEEEKRR